MKALCIAIFATFILALIIIYHDSQRSKVENTITPNDNIKVLICDGKVVEVGR